MRTISPDQERAIAVMKDKEKEKIQVKLTLDKSTKGKKPAHTMRMSERTIGGGKLSN